MGFCSVPLLAASLFHMTYAKADDALCLLQMASQVTSKLRQLPIDPKVPRGDAQPPQPALEKAKCGLCGRSTGNIPNTTVTAKAQKPASFLAQRNLAPLGNLTAALSPMPL